MSAPLGWLDESLAELDRHNLRRTLAERAGPQRGDRIEIDGQSLVNFGSNDYLGLAADPRIAAAVREAIDKHGWGSGASPLVTGRSSLHAELEQKLAEFAGTEAALLFPSGYAANVGAITSLVDKGDAIYSDELNHASIIDGCRLSGAAIHVFPHRDLGHLRQLLIGSNRFRRRLIVTESLFSMGGDLAPLPGLAELAERYDAILMVDEAHATGVFGRHGRGLCEESRVEEAVHLRAGTLSKALGSAGGFVVAQQRLIEWLVNRARPYMFSTAAPAALAAAALRALQLIASEPERRTSLSNLALYAREEFLRRRLSYDSAFSQIMPVTFGDARQAAATARKLRDLGLFVPAIRPPSVPAGQSLLRIGLTCLHTERQIDDLVAALYDVAK